MKPQTIFLLLIFISGCYQKRNIPYYSSKNQKYKDVISGYDQANLFLTKNLNTFISKVGTISSQDIPEQNKLSGVVRCQTLINQDGKIESIITLKSLNSIYDSLVINSIKNFEFVMLEDSSGNLLNYSVIVEYFFYKGEPLLPKVNFTNTYHLVHKPEPDEMKYIDLDLNTYCYDPRFDKYYQQITNKFQAAVNLPNYFHRKYPAAGRCVLALEVERSGNLIDFEILSIDGNKYLKFLCIDLVKSVCTFDEFPQSYPDPKMVLLIDFYFEDQGWIVNPHKDELLEMMRKIKSR